MLNSVLIEGIVRDVTLRDTVKGKPVCALEIEGDADGEELPNRFTAEAQGRLLDQARKVWQGQNVRVVGKLRQWRWIDPQGKQREKAVIMAEHIEARWQQETTGRKEKAGTQEKPGQETPRRKKARREAPVDRKEVEGIQ